MKPKSAVFLIREAWMRPVRVQPFDQPVDKTSAVIRPFIKITTKKSGRGELCSSCLAARKRSGRRIKPDGHVVQKRIKEGANLAIGSSPISARMTIKRLVEVSSRRVKTMFQKQP